MWRLWVSTVVPHRGSTLIQTHRGEHCALELPLQPAKVQASRSSLTTQDLGPLSCLTLAGMFL